MRQVILLPGVEAGSFAALAPSLPGCFCESGTEAEALENSKEAIELHTVGMNGHGDVMLEDVGAPDSSGMKHRSERFG
jgi:predicted RNase H-like HicB family nuclease